ncbi:tetratricopeptide repeat protein [Planktothrix sp. FACHB-1375]|uniref:Tetratricopeptide repeat protein n=1 Tax=Aerosakkonema funiforme FACHB-1375 TaxID=2949571 RepID=A0A926ZEQ8_9CYAN|nr:tetratricopeptide repeat protein [Aerosakkonema funiforme FACHB-1375]
MKGYLEAFHHLFETSAWNQALKIVTINIMNYGNNQLHNQLFDWGYYREIAAFYQRFLDYLENLAPYYKTILLYGMGKVHYALGYLTKAINCYQQALELARTLPDNQQEGAILNGLGLVYFSLGNYTQAINCYEQDLAIAWKNDNRQGQAAALNNLGLVFCKQEKFCKAIKYQKESLRISRQSPDHSAEGRALGSLAQAYSGCKKYDRAIEYHQQHLTIMRRIENRAGEAEALCNLGITIATVKEVEFNQALKTEDYSEALKYLHEALKISREIGIRLTEANVLLNLTVIYQRLGERNLVFKYCQQALSITSELGIPLESLKHLG